MWRSVFLHEFIDHKITNFKAVPGKLTLPSFNLVPSAAVVPGVNSVEVTNGTGLEYIFDEPLRDVIGLSCRMRVAYPIPNTGLGHMQGFSLLGLGPNVAVLALAQPDPPPAVNAIPSQFGINLAQPNPEGPGTVGEGAGVRVQFPSKSFIDLRVDWHTSGQTRLSVDGRLVRYRNDFFPGASFDIDRLSFGHPGDPPTPHAPQYQIARVFVRALTRTDGLVTLSRLLPQMPPTEDRGRCHLIVFTNLLRLLDRLRPFMAAFHQAKSQPWTEEFGPAEGPFQAEAVPAHQLAITSMLAFNQMLRTGDFSKPESFLEPFTEFLRILRASQPAQFDALAAELFAADVIPKSCRKQLESELEENRAALDPIINLLSAATARVQDIIGGNDNGGYPQTPTVRY
jgi:hypothetical protein